MDYNLTQTGDEVQQILDYGQNDVPSTLESLQADLASEESTRESADTALQEGLNSEASTRESADATLQTNINNEASTRQTADENLQTNIDEEAQARESADTTLQEGLNSEATTRESADSTLQTNINNEASTRQSADATLQTNINNEASTRQSADATLQTSIANEVTARQNADAALQSIVDILKQVTGVSETTESITMSVGKSGKVVDFESAQEVSMSNYGISSEISLTKGRLYLIPLSGSIDNSIAFLSRKSTVTYDKVITYTYTYMTINDIEVIETATADYDSTLVYTFSYDSSGNVLAILDPNGNTVSELPATREVTEDFYTPLVNIQVMPDSGYFLFIAAQDMNVVVSNKLAQLTGNIIVMDSGLAFNIAYSFMGQADNKVVCESFAQLFKKMAALAAVIDNMGDAKARNLDIDNMPQVVGTDMISVGDDEPDVPQFPGQIYIQSTGIVYFAIAVTNSASDWLTYDFATMLANISSHASSISSLSSALSSEASARESADSTLQTSINNEASTRQSADATLQTNINNEASTRQSADSTLQTNINNEASTRSTADATLQTNINTEASTRETSDLVLTEGEAYLYAKIKALEKIIDNLGDLKARTLELDEVPSACGGEMILSGSGAPTVVPFFVGQFYVDTTNAALYVAKAVTNSTSDWFQA